MSFTFDCLKRGEGVVVALGLWYWTHSFWRFDTWIWQASFNPKLKTIVNFTNLQALNSFFPRYLSIWRSFIAKYKITHNDTHIVLIGLSMCKVIMFKGRCQEGNNNRSRTNYAKSKMSIGSVPTKQRAWILVALNRPSRGRLGLIVKSHYKLLTFIPHGIHHGTN